MAVEESGTAMSDGIIIEATQRPVYNFLSTPMNRSDGSTYITTSINPEIDPVEIINTHSAHLFLHKAIVYKIKRSIAYSYLDMTSLASRELLCKRELEINKPVLPNIYLDVVPIIRSADGSLSFDQHGEVVEWVLRMNRFNEHQVLDTMAREGQLTVELTHRLGIALAEFHAKLDTKVVTDGHERIAEVVHELIYEFSVLENPLACHAVSLFSKLALMHLNKNQKLLNSRASDGYIKRCHGDLHLRNVLVQNGTPVPFDALEFNERMATTDILYDLAFMIMDLSHRGLREHENNVLNAYLLHSDPANTVALALLPLFLGCRAGIRAMTTAQAAAANLQNSVALSTEASKYLHAATNYMSVKPATLLAVGGLSGTGKSTIAKQLPTHLAASPGAVLLRSDAERKAALGMPEYDVLPTENYTAESANANYQRLSIKAAGALSAGYSVVVDATFLDQRQQRHFEALARSTCSKFIGIWLSAPLEILRNRIVERKSDASDATIGVLEEQFRNDHTAPGWHQIDVNCDAAEALHQCLMLIVADSRN